MSDLLWQACLTFTTSSNSYFYVSISSSLLTTSRYSIIGEYGAQSVMRGVVKCEQFIVIGCSVSGSRVARERGRFRGRRLPLKGER